MRTYRLVGARRNGVWSAADLNEQQRAAVEAPDGAHLVIAGPGSGKTRVITHRVAYLVKGGVPPGRILLVTFTNKAAREMLARVHDLLDGGGRLPWAGTFHHVGHRVLRAHASAVGFTENFSILDREDGVELIQQSLVDLGIRDRERWFPDAPVVADLMSFAVNTQTDLARATRSKRPDLEGFVPDFQRVANHYIQRKRALNALDFDDLLVMWHRVLVEDEAVRRHWAERFLHVLCDEYQDTNRLQGELLDLLARGHGSPMVVGDDCQCIYRFRGADYENILKFPDRWPQATIHRLELNYRSGQPVLDLANQSIAGNPRQFRKTLRVVPEQERPEAPRPALVPTTDPEEEAAFVCQRILECQADGIALGDMAVLYRSHAQSITMQVALAQRGLPHEVRSGARFFEQAHVKDLLAHLRLVENPDDELAWRRALPLYPGIGGKSAARFWSWLRGQPRALDAVLSPQAAEQFSSRGREGFSHFQAVVRQLLEEKPRARAGALVDIVRRGWYREHLRARFSDWRERDEDLVQLGRLADRSAALTDFLAQVALLMPAAEHFIPGEPPEDRLVLSTIHQAKGLEWRIVFFIGLVDGQMPSVLALNEPEGEEEERRLFYVAVTRVKDELYLVYPMGSGDGRLWRPSRFLREVDAELFEEWALESA